MAYTFFSKKFGRAIFSAGGFGDIMTIWCEMPLASRRTSFRVAEAERPGAILRDTGEVITFCRRERLGS